MTEEAHESRDVSTKDDKKNTRKEPGDAPSYAAPHVKTGSEMGDPDTKDARDKPRDKSTPCYLYAPGEAKVDMVEKALENRE